MVVSHRPCAGLSGDETLRLAWLSIESSPDAVYWFDDAMRIVYANGAASRTLGYSQAELLRMTAADIDPTDAAAGVGHSGPVARITTVHRHKDGRLIPVDLTATQIVIGEGRYVAATVRDISSRRQTEASIENSEPGAGIAPVRVLVVEDNRLNQRVACATLERLGITVELANNGREAVEAMRRGPDRFDAILMDMQMPEMDGLEATTVIRKEFPHRAVPIIAATANTQRSERAACLAAGMNDFVSKPIDPRRLQSTLARWVRVPSAPRPPTPAPVLPSIRGVDIESVLARLDGKHDLLIRLLRGFVQEQGAAAATIAAAIARGDFDGALRMAHTVKGVAGTLSANAVYEAARALEVGLRQRQRETLPAHVERLGAALEVVCRSVAGWTEDPEAPMAASAHPEPARAAIATVLTEFDGLLQNRLIPMDATRQSILLVDDVPANLEVLNAVLGADYELIFATSGQEALDLARDHLPDLILLDVVMPGMDGNEACRQLKADPRTKGIPIIFVTAMDLEEDEAAGLESGAIDYVTKPIRASIVRARVRNHLDLKRARDLLESLSLTDPLTGLPNRRQFDAVLETEIRRAIRSKNHMGLLMCDLDHFKAYNDYYGHPAGDWCLHEVASVFRETFRRAGELPARYGGEEFAVILPGAMPPEARVMGERIRQAVEARLLPHTRSESAPRVTVSVGVASMLVTEEASASWLVQRADVALYASKRAGRNRVTCADQ
jgi:diguanylate cyclase (GGDEF)-like protein/PAS domain S-box-containing protein